MTYDDLLNDLNGCSEEKFADFQRRLIPTKSKILGVRTPTLRLLAKKYYPFFEEIVSYPDEYYEVTFIKLTMISSMEFSAFNQYVEYAVDKIDNWATCDTFKPKCLKTKTDEFLPILESIFMRGGEFDERFALVILLGYYLEEKYFTQIRKFIVKANTERYYVRMAVAWLVAEILIKFPLFGEEILLSGDLDDKTRDKAIQKARESYRLGEKEKEYLNSLKMNKKNK